MRLALALLAVAVVAVPGALAADPGVSSDEIVLGSTAPISGPESAYAVVAQGAKAYFDYVNANGGVLGRDIRYIYLDDAYDPAQTIQQTRQLVEQERVFAIFNVVGTEHTLATRPYLNQLGVPQLFVGSGASALVRDAAKYPWTMGYLPSFFAEGRFYGGTSRRRVPAPRSPSCTRTRTSARTCCEACGTACGARARSSPRRAMP